MQIFHEKNIILDQIWSFWRQNFENRALRFRKAVDHDARRIWRGDALFELVVGLIPCVTLDPLVKLFYFPH